MTKGSSLIADVRRFFSLKRRHRIALFRLFRQPTARFRTLPSFVIIGAQRGGTSSLFNYLASNDHLIPSSQKESQYFSREFHRGPRWYRAHFPLKASLAALSALRGGPVLAFEATPSYLFFPWVPKRASELIPEAKLVVLLREPVARAYSGFLQAKKRGRESSSFLEALKAEEAVLREQLAQMAVDPDYFPDGFRKGYASRGFYDECLERWLEFYPARNFLLIDSDRLFTKPEEVLGEVAEFLGIPVHFPSDIRRISAISDHSSRVPMTGEERAYLEAIYEPHNRRLKTMLKETFGLPEGTIGWL